MASRSKASPSRVPARSPTPLSLRIERWRGLVLRHPRLLDVGIIALMVALGVAVAHNLLREGFPPGVDTPTFLHMSWFTQETLRGNGGFTDPYWYGGFPVFTTYPPLSYGLVGGLAAIPGLGLVFVYKSALIAAYIATGLATYYLAIQIGHSRPWAALAGILTILSYPVLVAAGLWGWYSSVVALPLALLALALLERAYRRNSGRTAIFGGLSLGLAFLAHHMTAGALALGLPAWFLFYYLRQPHDRPALSRTILFFAVAAVISTIWWIIPWLVNLLESGFERETPGIWSFPLTRYLEALGRRDLIGKYAYPNYVGLGLIGVMVGGLLHAFFSPSRTTPYAILLALLLAFSLGEQTNPLIKIPPLNGLDVARFQLYMVPILAIVGLPFLASMGSAIAQLIGASRLPGWFPAMASIVLVALVLGQTLLDAAVASQKLFKPYQVTEATQEMIRWLDQDGHEGTLLGVGFWHWDDFLLPYSIRRPVVDGWHDEGARNWRTVRQLRQMMWTGEIIAPKVYQLLGELGGRYIAVQDFFMGESPDKFRATLRGHPDLFKEVADWGEVTLFERVAFTSQ